jgi:uncharacterized protein (UPF0548 family)
VFSLTIPSTSDVQRFLARQRELPYTYAAVGATRAHAPHGFKLDTQHVQIGCGRGDFERGKSAVRRWEMFNMPWIRLHWPSAPIEPGATVGVLARAARLWSLNAARIVYVVDEPERFGFAYGTLPGHVECGEELFLVELSESGSVDYRITAFSRPNHFAAKLAYPWVRHLQKRFARGSVEAMRRAIEEARAA